MSALRRLAGTIRTFGLLPASLGGQVAENGLKWIFVTNGHSAPTHNIALNEPCDFVSETYGVTMLHLTALFRADPAIQAIGDKIRAQHFSGSEIASFGMDVHAGPGETSGMLALRPDLVRPMYKTLPSRAGESTRNCVASRPVPAGRGICHPLPKRRRLTDVRLKPGGSMASRP